MSTRIVRNTRLWRKNPDGTGLVFVHRRGQPRFLHLNQEGMQIFGYSDGRTSEEIAQIWTNSEKIPLAQAREETADFLAQIESMEAITFGGPKYGRLSDEWETAKEKVDVLLVIPPNPASSREEVPVPLGVLMLAASLRQAGYSVAVFDMFLNDLHPSHIEAAIRKYEPDLIGVSIITASAPSAYEIVEWVQRNDPGILLVAGGIHATNCPEDVLRHGFDVATRHEGIETIVEVACCFVHQKDRKGLFEISGIAFLWRGEILINKDRPLVKPADRLPFPARDLIELNRYPQKGAIMSSFGCNRRCKFCTVYQNPDMIYRARCTGHVIGELQGMQAMGIKTGNFVDDSFLLSSKRAGELCRAIIDSGIEMSLACQSRVDDACKSPATLELMVEAGFTAIEFGVESGNQEVLDWCGKGITLEQALLAVRLAKAAGFQRIGCGMILGHPVDTKETIEESIRFSKCLIEQGASNIALAICTPFPGSDIALNAAEYGLKIRSRDWSRYNFREAVMDTLHLKAEELEEIYLDGLYRIHLALAKGGDGNDAQTEKGEGDEANSDEV